MTSLIPIPLDPQIHPDRHSVCANWEEPHWCENCGRRRNFLVLYVVEQRGVGVCEGCEERVFVPFTKVTAEAA